MDRTNGFQFKADCDPRFSELEPQNTHFCYVTLTEALLYIYQSNVVCLLN